MSLAYLCGHKQNGDAPCRLLRAERLGFCLNAPEAWSKKKGRKAPGHISNDETTSRRPARIEAQFVRPILKKSRQLSSAHVWEYETTVDSAWSLFHRRIALHDSMIHSYTINCLDSTKLLELRNKSTHVFDLTTTLSGWRFYKKK